MSLSYSEITTVSVDAAKAQLLQWLDGAGFTATSWQEGSVPLALVELGARVWARQSEVAESLKGLIFNDTAIGEALTRFSTSHYANTRVGAIPAQYSIRLSNAAGVGYPIDVGDVVVTDGEYEFANVADGVTVYPAVLPAGGTLTLLFEAQIPGADASVAAASITNLVTAFAGVTLSHQSQVSIGTDEESDATLRARNATKWPTLNLAEPISEAIVNVALNADATITRAAVDDSNPRGPGTFDAYVATNVGAAGGSAIAAAQAAIEVKVFGGSATAQVYTATVAPMGVAGVVYYAPGFAPADVQTAVQAQVDAWLGTLPIGGQDVATGLTGVVSLNELEHQIRSTQIAGVDAVRGVTLTAPAANFPVGPFEIAVATSYTLTYTAARS